jgi:hypothetical protein
MRFLRAGAAFLTARILTVCRKRITRRRSESGGRYRRHGFAGDLSYKIANFFKIAFKTLEKVSLIYYTL